MPATATAVEFQVVSKRDAERLVFGYAVLATKRDGTPLVDLQGDVVVLRDLETVGYEYVESMRKRAGDGGEMHDGPAPFVLVESMILTPEKLRALGIAKGTVPLGWWIGFRATPEGYRQVELGKRLMFSIEGKGARVPLSQADPALLVAA